MANSKIHNGTSATARAIDGLRLLLLAGGTVMVLLGAFCIWQTWLIANESSAIDRVHAAQDRAVRTLGELLARDQRLVSEAVEMIDPAKLRTDPQAAAAAIKSHLPQALAVDVYSGRLDEVLHADYGHFGYSKAAQLLAAQGDDRASQVQSIMPPVGKERRLSFAVPLGDARDPNGWVWIEFPFTAMRQAFDAVPAAGGRLELRQGDDASALNLFAHGASSAEKEPTTKSVPGSTFSVGAALPRAFIVLPRSTVLAALLSLVALILGATLLWLFARPRREHTFADDSVPLPALESPAAPAPAIPALAAPAAMPPAPVHAPVDPEIFRAYDIRGVVGDTLSEEVARLIGQAVGAVMREQGLREIVVGRDGRDSGPALAGALIDGLRDADIDVIDLGAVPTPLVYFAAYRLNTGCGVAVTGSHNPPAYNGFKIVIGGDTLAEEAITDLYQRIAAGGLPSNGQGNLRSIDVVPDYVERVATDVLAERSLKVVVDAGNGIAGAVAPQVLEAIGCEVIALHCEVDGSFPNHHPDPSDPANLEDLKAAVRHYSADIGLAFDGDGDRLGVVTRVGEIIYPDRVLMLFARDVLSRQPGATVIYDVKCTGHLKGQVLDAGGSPLMWRTGHSLIKAKMRQTSAELAGEMSGHFFFKERWYGFDDGIYAAARLLEILAGDPQERVPEAIFATCPKGVSTPELKVPPTSGTPAQFMDTFLAQASFGEAALATIDGVRADWTDGWGLVRASNTTPVLVMRFDADDAPALARIQAVFKAQLLAVDSALTLPF